MTQPQEGCGRLSCLSHRSSGPDPSQTQSPWWLGSHIWAEPAKVRSSDCDLKMERQTLSRWGNSHDLNYPHKPHCHQLGQEMPGDKSNHIASSWCIGCLPRYTMYPVDSVAPKAEAHFRTIGKANGTHGIWELSSSPCGTKWPGIKWGCWEHAVSLGLTTLMGKQRVKGKVHKLLMDIWPSCSRPSKQRAFNLIPSTCKAPMWFTGKSHADLGPASGSWFFPL